MLEYHTVSLVSMAHTRGHLKRALAGQGLLTGSRAPLKRPNAVAPFLNAGNVHFRQRLSLGLDQEHTHDRQ